VRPFVIATILAGSMAYPGWSQAVAPRTFKAPQQEKLQRALRQALPSRNHQLSTVQPHVLPPLSNEQSKRKESSEGPTLVGIHRSLDPAVMQSARRD
jgi:hypothetical protein